MDIFPHPASEYYWEYVVALFITLWYAISFVYLYHHIRLQYLKVKIQELMEFLSKFKFTMRVSVWCNELQLLNLAISIWQLCPSLSFTFCKIPLSFFWGGYCIMQCVAQTRHALSLSSLSSSVPRLCCISHKTENSQMTALWVQHLKPREWSQKYCTIHHNRASCTQQQASL